MFENQFKHLFEIASTRNEQQFSAIIHRLDKIICLLDTKLNTIITKENTIMATIQNVTDAVAAESSVDDSIVALLNGIVQQLKDAQATGNPAALDAVVSAIQANTAKIQAAVTANTPVTPVQASATA